MIRTLVAFTLFVCVASAQMARSGITLGNTGETVDFTKAAIAKPAREVTANPGSCTDGEWIRNTTDHHLYICDAGTWTQKDGGGSSTLYDEITLGLGECDVQDFVSGSLLKLYPQWTVVNGSVGSGALLTCDSYPLGGYPRKIVRFTGNSQFMNRIVNLPTGFVSGSTVTVTMGGLNIPTGTTVSLGLKCGSASMVGSSYNGTGATASHTFTYSAFSCAAGTPLLVEFSIVAGLSSSADVYETAGQLIVLRYQNTHQ